MNSKKFVRIPTGVSFIAAFYLLGAIVLLISFFTNRVHASRMIASVHGLPSVFDPYILPGIAGIALLMAFGLLAGARWGYIFSIAYLSVFGGVSIWHLAHGEIQPYLGNATWSAFVLLYLIGKRKYFLDNRGDDR